VGVSPDEPVSVDRPCPLEVERPRLPWWTLLPRQLLWAISPVIVVVILVMVLVFLAQRVWRYPLFLIGGTILTGLGVGYSRWVSAGVLAGLGVTPGSSSKSCRGDHLLS
jgi:DNA segregation ATPase FtsK/SpoIIIE, S-DNA-T family